MNGLINSDKRRFLTAGMRCSIFEPINWSRVRPKSRVHILLQLQTAPLSLTESNASVTLSNMASIGVEVLSDWVIVASISS